VTIHKVTDQSPFEKGESGTCPVGGVTNFEIDEITDTPSVQEYKKLRRVMAMITKFDRDGSETKKKNWETMTTEVAKLEIDEAMAQAQVEALNLPLFKVKL